MRLATVEYQIATYSGTVTVRCDEDDENEVIIARAKLQLMRDSGSFPYGCQQFDVVSRVEY